MKRTNGRMNETPPPAVGMAREFSAQTPLARKAGNISMTCDECGLSYRTFLAWAKKSDKHFCGHGCASAAKLRQVEMKCVICSAGFLVKQSMAAQAKTCSARCFRENKRRRMTEEHLQAMAAGKLHNAANERGPL
jgi:hypothetical protein